MTHRVGAAGTGGPHPADGSVVGPVAPATPDRQETIRGLESGSDPLPLLRQMVSEGKKRQDPTLSVALSIGMLDALIARVEAAEQDAAALAEALRDAVAAIITAQAHIPAGQSRLSTREFLRVLAAHDERVRR